jgi:hypothetical protein
MPEILPYLVTRTFALLLGAIFVAVVFRLVNGEIHTGRLLAGSNGRGHSPARVQMLAFTLIGAMQYLTMALKDTSRLPEPPRELLLMVGGSHAVFMVSKSFPALLSIFAERLLKR